MRDGQGSFDSEEEECEVESDCIYLELREFKKLVIVDVGATDRGSRVSVMLSSQRQVVFLFESSEVHICSLMWCNRAHVTLRKLFSCCFFFLFIWRSGRHTLLHSTPPSRSIDWQTPVYEGMYFPKSIVRSVGVHKVFS